MRVSIIVPVFNVSAYIERCINSVMNQTYGDIECIIVDDATPDDSILKCEQMIASYNGPIQFSILHHEILNHLTPNKEQIELSGLVYAFCRFYCLYVDEVPAMIDTYGLYKQKARQYSCWYVFFILCFVGIVKKFCTPIEVMKKLHVIRWRIIELPDILFCRI